MIVAKTTYFVIKQPKYSRTCVLKFIFSELVEESEMMRNPGSDLNEDPYEN